MITKINKPLTHYIDSFLCIGRLILNSSALVLVAGAALLILASNIELLRRGNASLSFIYFLCMFLITLSFSREWMLRIFVFLLPLIPGFHWALLALTGIKVPTVPMMGMDLVAGGFLGLLCKHLFYSVVTKKTDSLSDLMAPWPIALVLLIVSISTAIAISRNVWISAAPIDAVAIPIGLIHGRTIGWFEDLRPLTDWLAYAMATASFILASNCLRGQRERDPIIFRPLLLGLLLSAIWAIIQNKTGMGYPEPPIYKDILGFAPYGFQPDLHAYAGYTLLGALGLWVYLFKTQAPWERYFILLVIVLSWYGLIASMSKASILIAILTTFFILIAIIYRFQKQLWNTRPSNAKTFYFPVVSIVLLIVVTGYLVQTFNWFNDLITRFAQIQQTDFNQINALLSERPILWLVAIRMFIDFPLFGIGQGNYYQFSPLFNYEKLPILVGGENTHNYFLQTLAEIGIIGGLIFTIALALPFIRSPNRQVLMPATFALAGLFLGNIYAHSFLIRENLFLAAVFLSLLYAYMPQGQTNSALSSLTSWKPKLILKIMFGIASTILIIAGIRELNKSFTVFPFEYGSRCFINAPISPDKWSAGLYQIPLPIGARSFELKIRVARPHIEKNPLRASLEIRDPNNRILSSEQFEWRENGPQKLILSMPDSEAIPGAGYKASLRLSSCFTPRNIGQSIDGRRLGIIVESSTIN